MRRGEIYLVNFDKRHNSEFGKIRPAMIIQNDIANRNIDKVEFKGVTVIPMTSFISGGDLRVKIPKRDNLDKASELCINELCTLDMSRIDLTVFLTKATPDEMAQIELKLSRHLGF